LRCLLRRLAFKGFDVFHGDAPLRREGRGLACLLACVTLVGVILLAGCGGQKELPVYSWETPEEALKVLGTQNNGLVTFEAVLEEEAVCFEGEGGLPCEARVSFHLYAWQHEKVRVDLEKDEKVVGSAVYQANTRVLSEKREMRADALSFDGESSIRLKGATGPVAEAWVLYRRGIFRDSPKYQGLGEEKWMVWGSERATSWVEARTLTVQRYVTASSTDRRPERLVMVELSDYQTKGGITWPARMKVTCATGKEWDLRFTRVKINEDLPARVFEDEAAPKAGD
jgi:hypothetical protein